MNIYRGAEWRRWELHLHTPFTQKEDKFLGDTPDEKWDNFYNAINEYIGDGTDSTKSICTIAITDYLSIDNYITVRKHRNRLPDCVKLLLPNVELRMRPIAKNSPLNIHCIFSPDIADELETRFFAKLEFEYSNKKYSASKNELRRLGREYSRKSDLPNDEAYKTALDQYIISLETLSTVFKNDPDLRKKTIIVVSNKSNDGASGTKAHNDYFVGDISQLEATQQSVYQKSDMIYSANPSDIKYFLGEGVDSEGIVKHKCGSLMPCIHGCDAHTNNKIFEPDQKRYCWIKADPTFEGFKQILYEPKERVRISSTYPDEKQSYHLIDRIEILENEDFDSNPIYFNSNLNCIIGGKSTGKSLLLHNIALAIDEKQVKEKENVSTTNVKRLPQLKVYWCDGVCNDIKDKPRKIVYIPQTYLNRLSDEREKTTEIDDIIQNIVLQDSTANQLYLEMKENITEHKKNIGKTVIDFLQTVSDHENLLKSKMEIGDKDSIDSEITELVKTLEGLSKEYNVTRGEISTYQTAVEEIQRINNYIQDLEKERKIVTDIKSVLQKKDVPQKEISYFAFQLTEAVDKIQILANDQWYMEQNNILKQIDEKIEISKSSMIIHKTQETELKPKMEGSEQIKKISELITAEKNKLEKVLNLDKKLEENKKIYDEQMSILTNAFETYEKFYLYYINSVNEIHSNTSNDLEFRVERVFRIEDFKQKMFGILNNKSISRFCKIDLHKLNDQDLLDTNNIRLLIESILTNSSTTLQLKKGTSYESVLRDIFDDWNNLNYIVSMDRDNIEDMSPGKKALVLLRLLINLAESKSPILIDQPEDDLDNRSIFNELIQFIKTKKVDRQIIIVTHNANIVLGGDAELVIVANQIGNNSPNKNYRFEYRGGAIENNQPVVDEKGKPLVGILNQKGIQTHICEILEGGEKAFDLRKNKYRFTGK